MQPISPQTNSNALIESLSGDRSIKLKLASLLAGLGAVLGLFVVIPFTQLIRFEPSSELYLEDMVMLERKNPVMQAIVDSETMVMEPPTPSLEHEDPILEISMMDLQLKPSYNQEILASMNQSFLNQVIEDAGNYRGILDFDELSHPPTIVYLPDIQFPEALVAQDIKKGEVVVTIVIDEEGRASCENVQSSSHPLLVEVVRQVVRKTRFSVSMVDGQPVKVRGTWPLMLKAPG